MGNELPKDELFAAKSCELGKNSKGGDHVKYSMQPEAAVGLALSILREVAGVEGSTTIADIETKVSSVTDAVIASREQDFDVAKLEQLKARKSFKNPRGVRLDIHMTEKATNDGRVFLSGIMFSKGIQEFGSTPKPGAPNRSASAQTSSATKQAVDRLRRPQ